MSQNGRQSKAQERRRRVWELVLEGYQYREIAAKIEREYRNSSFRDADDLPKDWGHQYVAKDVYEELKNVKDEVTDMAQKHLTIQVQRIERMIRSLWRRAQKEDTKPAEIDAIKTINRLQKRKAKLLGLDDPERIKHLQGEDDSQTFEWPDPEDAPQLTTTKSQEKTNGEQQAELHENGHKDSEGENNGSS